jgi:hypothetical protein
MTRYWRAALLNRKTAFATNRGYVKLFGALVLLIPFLRN